PFFVVSLSLFGHYHNLVRAESARSNSGGLHHAEDSNCACCILGDAERCRRCRPASQGAAASGASSGWQVAGRQGSDWQISTSSARRDQGLTVCVLDARKIERSGCAFHYHSYAPLRRGISFDWNPRWTASTVTVRRSTNTWARRRTVNRGAITL